MTSIDGGASGNFSSSGPEPFEVEDIDAFGATAIRSKVRGIEKISKYGFKGVTTILRLPVSKPPRWISSPRLRRLSDTRDMEAVELKAAWVAV